MPSAQQPENFGPYKVYERLGVGGMATVHRATRTGIEGFHRWVALKRLLPHLAEDQSFVKSFIREAKLASHLHHSHIAQIYDLGRENGVYYITMELVRGCDLRQILRHAAYSVGPPPLPVAVSLIAQLCDALTHAHTSEDQDGNPLGIVHRDISPSNALISRRGQLKVIDFGVAKAKTSSLETQSGQVKGKFSYMSPEILSGEDPDLRSDIFSAGIVCHELLVARPLFSAKKDYEAIRAVREMPIPAPSSIHPQIPIAIDTVVYTALSRDKTTRYQTAAEFRQALVSACGQPLATPAQVANWMEWAFSQPTQKKLWDQRKQAGKQALSQVPKQPRNQARSPTTQNDLEDMPTMMILDKRDRKPRPLTEREQETIEAVWPQDIGADKDIVNDHGVPTIFTLHIDDGDTPLHNDPSYQKAVAAYQQMLSPDNEKNTDQATDQNKAQQAGLGTNQQLVSANLSPTGNKLSGQKNVIGKTISRGINQKPTPPSSFAHTPSNPPSKPVKGSPQIPFERKTRQKNKQTVQKKTPQQRSAATAPWALYVVILAILSVGGVIAFFMLR